MASPSKNSKKKKKAPLPGRRPLPGVPMKAQRAVAALGRRVLLRYARGGRKGLAMGANPPVTILLSSAWGMGGTIRAAINLAGYLAPRHEVEILSVIRRRDTSFFGDFPPGIKVTALDDERAHARRGPAERVLRPLLRRLPSLLMHPGDRNAPFNSLWSDVQMVRQLRGRTGVLVGTRPGLNYIAARMTLPTLATIGLEQMHLHHHTKRLKEAMKRDYGSLDVLVVLTETDIRNYTKLLKKRAPRLVAIPNTVRPLGGAAPDLGAKQIFAAGRLVAQKGFDMLIPAFAQVTGAHPDWRLRICGHGKLQGKLEGLVDKHGLSDVVSLDPATSDIGADMAKASIFALSSRFEGFPLILLEAMSKGMSVVAFDCPTGPADIIDDRRNGILVPPKDVDAFAAGLRTLIEDEDLRRRCGAAAVTTAQLHTIEAIGPRWDALLAELVAGRRDDGPAGAAQSPAVPAGTASAGR